VIQDVLLAVEQLLSLRRDGRRDPRMGVPGVGDADPRRVVEVALAVAGDQPGALATVHVQVRDAAPDGRDHGMVGQRRRRRGKGLDHGWGSGALGEQRLRGARPERSEVPATSPTAPRKMIEPMTLIWTGSALR